MIPRLAECVEVNSVGRSSFNMNLISRILSTAAVCAAVAISVYASTAEVGQPAPDFKLTDINGQSYTLSQLKGKTVVLEWTNPECPIVGRHYNTGNIPTLQKEATADGVVWLAINSGSKGAQGDLEPAQVKTWLSKTNAVPSAYFRDRDGTVGKMYGAKTTPHMFVINPDGVLIYAGGIDNDRKSHVGAQNYVRDALSALKNGQPIAKSSAEPYGCSVKY
jgi:hypothetical protein